MNSKDFWKYLKNNPDGVSLTVAHSGSETVTAKIYDGNLLVVDFTNLGSDEYVTVNTPFSFEVADFWLRVTNGGEVASKTLTLQNGSDAISSALSMTTDVTTVRPTTMDSAYTSFTKDDNDLKLVSSAHADGDGRAYILVTPA